MDATTDRRAPVLFDETPLTELLVPILADQLYERGVSVARRYAEAWDLPIRMVHVRSPSDGLSAEHWQDRVDAACARIEEGAPGVRCSGQVLEGDDVVEVICSGAEPGSLVVLATDAASQWSGSNSVGEQLARRIDSAVLLCGPKCSDPPLGGAIVVALDGSRRAEAALPDALTLADSLGAMLWLVTVVRPDTTEQVRRLRERGEQVSESGYLRATAAQLDGHGVEVSWVVLHGDDPVEEILAFAAQHQMTMVVAGTHGNSALSQQVFGSVCMGLVHRSGPPVLVVRSAAAAQALEA